MFGNYARVLRHLYSNELNVNCHVLGWENPKFCSTLCDRLLTDMLQVANLANTKLCKKPMTY